MFPFQAHGFSQEPKLFIHKRLERFAMGDYGCPSIDRVGPGVYVWIEPDTGEPLYIGLYGRRAVAPTFRGRLAQHVGGLNAALRGKAPTRGWRQHLLPGMLQLLERPNARVDLHFRGFDLSERQRVVEFERELIRTYQPRWNVVHSRDR